FGLNRVVRYAVWGFTGAMMLLLALFLAGFDGIPVLSSLTFIAFAFLGLVLPTTGVLAMEEHGAIAGTASALLGTLQTVAGAVVMGIVAAFFNGTAMPMVVGFAVCALIVFVLTQLTIRGDDDAVVAEPAEGFSMH
ncbi:MAG TPA: Bcr/CflA family drug resistance efflux transporter, partial [Devosiaceae bacterium]|nr:Bcr/CflA family drug resistance efflux transporter [Devosiaceae bacterium]